MLPLVVVEIIMKKAKVERVSNDKTREKESYASRKRKINNRESLIRKLFSEKYEKKMNYNGQQ